MAAAIYDNLIRDELISSPSARNKSDLVSDVLEHFRLVAM